MKNVLVSITVCLAVLSGLLAGCTAPRPGPGAASPTPSQAAQPGQTLLPPTQTPTPLPPTPTPEPLAARVNGAGISLAEFNAALARYKDSGTNLATQNNMTDESYVLNDLVQETLLAQGAQQGGFVLDDAALQARLDQLAAKVNLADWLAANHYSEAEFRTALRRSVSAAWMRDQIAGQAPEKAEQVHVIQILLYNLDDANQVFSQLQNGADFDTLAHRYDPATGGELGWVAHGTFADPTLEDAAFSLQPGSYSQVIQTPAGYHILYILERDPERVLEASARQVVQEKAIQNWLDAQQKAGQIEILIP